MLASFGVVWSRSRFMGLDGGCSVPEHADTSYHWFSRVRLHIPVVTWPEVLFRCGDESVHRSAGEAWVFDNWRRHSVVNLSDRRRVHLVADTVGNSRFWQFVADSTAASHDEKLPYRPELDARVLTELAVPRPLLPPAEVDVLVNDIISELCAGPGAQVPAAQVRDYANLLIAFCRDWRQLYILHGEGATGIDAYRGLLLAVQDASRRLAAGLVIRTNLGAPLAPALTD